MKTTFNHVKVTTKPGDTWARLMEALPSHKPWVSRSLRPWGVQFTKAAVRFVWGDNRATITREYFTNAAAYILFGKLPGSIELHVGAKDGRLQCCEKDDEGRLFSLSTKFVTFVFLGTDGEKMGVQVPTKLIIEALRMSRQGQDVNRGQYWTKTQRRHWSKRVKNSERREHVRNRGDHRRWWTLAQLVRMVQESDDVKEITPEELAGGVHGLA